jgi:TnpA family transposase
MSGEKEYRNKIREILLSKDYHDSVKVELVLKVLDKEESHLYEEIFQELDKLENTGAKSLKDQLLYEELGKGYRRLSNRVAGILQVLEFNPQSSKPEIYKAIRYFQQKAGKVKENDAPLEFIPGKEWKRLFAEDGSFITNLYKIFLFKAVFDGIRSGKLNLLFSERYKYVDDYLIHTDRWRKDRTELLARAGLLQLDKKPQEILDNLKVSLNNRYKITNGNIGSNQYIKFDSKGIAKVKTPKRPDSEDGSIAEFIGKDSLIPLSRILSDIAYYVDYISSFTHYNRKNVKSTPSIEAMYAAIIALGCNIEVRKMGKISEGVSADILEYVVRWFFSKENIDEANCKVITLINNLPLSEIYLDNENQVNTSSDGQKFNVRVPSLNAGRSPKYFGMDNIVSAYSSIDAKGRLTFGGVHSPRYRESNFVVDALTHNPDVISDTHATDTHGYTEVIFGICNLLGIDFTPRIKNYHEQILYTFKSAPRKVYESNGYKILPSKSMYINEQVILEQWEQVLRFLCTIKLRETLPSNILKRLGSYSRQHPLHRVLKEIGKIYKTCFLLRYFDELPLRQDIEKQLNRIELSHLFAHAVFFGGNQAFHYATKEEQDMALGCRQLIQNAIVLWNYLCISEKLAGITDTIEQKRQIDKLKGSSIMTWQHVNMHGKYDFNLEMMQMPFDLHKIKSLTIN